MSKNFFNMFDGNGVIRFLESVPSYEEMSRRIMCTIRLEDVDGEMLYILDGSIFKYPEEFSSIYRLMEWLDYTRNTQYNEYDLFVSYIIPDGEDAATALEAIQADTRLIWALGDDEESCITMLQAGSRPLSKCDFD